MSDLYLVDTTRGITDAQPVDIIEFGPGEGMDITVSQESVLDELKIWDFVEQHKGKLIAGGLALAGAVYYWRKRK